MINEVYCWYWYWIFILIIISFDLYNGLNLDLVTLNNDKRFTMNNLIKAKNEFRNFYKFNLTNGLEVYVINDKHTKIEGAAMVVKSGAKMDKDVLGLAHFTEHMLFLGSKKYPGADYFVDFITSRHGKHNGATRLDSTQFYFKIDNKYFSQAFDIFSRFFIDPLLNSSYIEKEINSVNSEFVKNCQIDSYKKEHVFRLLSNPNSLMKRFRTGNNQTLFDYTRQNNLNLTKLVRDYLNEYYVPNNMQLIIYGGSKQFNHYKKLVEAAFSDLKAKNFTLLTEKEKPFEVNNGGTFTFYNTLRDIKGLEINYIIPDELSYDKSEKKITNSDLIIKFILNQKAKGSLFYLLNKQGYITKLSSNSKLLYNKHYVFRINLILTGKGILEMKEVLNILEDYMEFLRKELSFLDLHQIKHHYENIFNGKHENINVFSYLKKISKNIQNYNDKYILSTNKILYDLEEEKNKLVEYMKYLSLGNSQIIFGNKFFDSSNFEKFKNFLINFDDKLILKETDPWLNTNYGSYKINLSRNISKTSQEETFSLDFLMASNKTNKDNHICKNKMCIKKLNLDENDISPIMILNNTQYEIYHKVNNK